MEKFITRLLGVDIIARMPKDYPEELQGEPLEKQLTNAKEHINGLIEKEYKMPTDEELKKYLGIK